MKKLLVLGVVVVALMVGALVAYAFYNVEGSSTPESFAAGSALDLVPDPASEDLTDILPGQTRDVRVSVYNPNPGPVTVTGVDLTFSPVCALSTTPWGPGPHGIAANASSGYVFVVPVTMGDAHPNCEGATLQVTATVVGTMP